MSLPHALETVKFTGFDCPKCRERLFVEGSGPADCPKCEWNGEVYILKALKERAETARDALPEKAVCVHHPTKQATAICEGTGDYICALCAVEMDGKIFSAEYLSRAGKGAMEKTYSRFLDRPDTNVTYLMAASVLIWPLAPLFLPFAVLRYVQAIRLRGTDPIFNRVFTRWDIFYKGFLLLAMIVITVVIILAIMAD